MPDWARKRGGQFKPTCLGGRRSVPHEKERGHEGDTRSRGERETGLEIPAELCEELSALAAKKGFQSVQEFVIHILREEATRGRAKNGPSAFSAHELELIRKLL